MKFEIEHGKLELLTDLLRDTVEESKVDVTPDGMSISQIDDVESQYVGINFPSTSFISYEMEGADEGFRVGMDWEQAYDVVSYIDDESVTCEIDPENGNMMFTTDSGFEYEMSLLALGGIVDGDPPDIDFGIEFKCTAGDVYNVIGSGELVNQSDDSIHIEIEGDGDKQEVIGWASGDTNKVQNRIIEGVTGLENAHTEVAIPVLKGLIGNLPGDTTLDTKMHFDGGRGQGKNYPIRFDANHEGIELVLWVAPMVRQ